MKNGVFGASFWHLARMPAREEKPSAPLRDRAALPSFLRDMPLARMALAWAAALHHGQHRESDGAPFIVHPLEVAALLASAGFPEIVVVAGILHDTVENTGATTRQVRDRCGPEVASIVAALSEDPAIPDFAERKAALRTQVAEYGQHATAVYAADKIAKARELRAQAVRDSRILATDSTRTTERLDHYRQSLILLEQIEAKHPLVRQLRFELEMLDALKHRQTATSGPERRRVAACCLPPSTPGG